MEAQNSEMEQGTEKAPSSAMVPGWAARNDWELDNEAMIRLEHPHLVCKHELQASGLQGLLET